MTINSLERPPQANWKRTSFEVLDGIFGQDSPVIAKDEEVFKIMMHCYTAMEKWVALRYLVIDYQLFTKLCTLDSLIEEYPAYFRDTTTMEKFTGHITLPEALNGTVQSSSRNS